MGSDSVFDKVAPHPSAITMPSNLGSIEFLYPISISSLFAHKYSIGNTKGFKSVEIIKIKFVHIEGVLGTK